MRKREREGEEGEGAARGGRDPEKLRRPRITQSFAGDSKTKIPHIPKWIQEKQKGCGELPSFYPIVSPPFSLHLCLSVSISFSLFSRNVFPVCVWIMGWCRDISPSLYLSPSPSLCVSLLEIKETKTIGLGALEWHFHEGQELRTPTEAQLIHLLWGCFWPPCTRLFTIPPLPTPPN